MAQFIYKTARELAALIRTKKSTSLEIVTEHISHIKKHNEALNAVVMLFEENAIKDADLCDQETKDGISRGPLHGVPMTVKECFWMKGIKSTVNFKLLKDWVAPEDAIVVERLKQAGAIIVGKTNVPKNLADWQVLGDIYPIGRNPFNLAHSPGGSSGGSATALATGMSPIEVGSDLGGSIRLPANYCGVYGLKPTESTIPSYGEFPIPGGAKGSVFHMATSGPMARDLDDLELLWNVIKGPDKRDRKTTEINWQNSNDKTLSDFKISWLDCWPEYSPSIQTKTVIGDFVETLKANNETLINQPPQGDLHHRSLSLHIKMFTRLISQNSPWVVKQLIKLDLKKGILKGVNKFDKVFHQGFKNSFLNYSESMADRALIIADWESYFEEFDLLICPMSFDSAIKHCKTGDVISHKEKEVPYLDYTWPYLACFNASGHPGINIPLGIGEHGLPVGVQVVGPYWSEPDLIQFAKLVAKLNIDLVKPKGFN